MANWKKVIVSGSSADLAALNVDGTIDASIITVSQGSGSFSGSFQGDGSGLKNVPATGIVLSLLTGSDGVESFSYNGQADAQVKVKASGSTLTVGSTGVAVSAAGITSTELASNSVITAKILDGNVTNAKLANSSIYMAGGAGLTGDGSTALGASGSIAVGAGLGITVNADDVALDTGSAHFTAGVRGKISVVDNAGDGSLTYDSGTGVLTYSGVTSGSVRGYFSAADTTGASGIDMAYDSTTGVFSGSLVNSAVTIGNESVSLGGTLTNISGLTASGSFSGSFFGNGAGLTGVPATGIVLSSLTDGNGIADFTYNGQSPASVTVEVSGSTLGVGASGVYVAASGITTNEINDGAVTSAKLDTNISLTNLTVTNDLVVQGTASFQNTENLRVSDRFILMASGSTSAGDGGIVVQQSTADTGEAFGWDNVSGRWGVTGSFNAGTSAITQDAFMAAVVVGAGTDPNAAPARYDKAGNMFVGTDGEIYIYS